MNKDNQFEFLIRDIKRGIITHVLKLGYMYAIKRFSCHNDVLFCYLEDGSVEGLRVTLSKHVIKKIVMRKNEYDVTVPTSSDILFYG